MISAEKSERVLVTGGTGLVGAAICRRLAAAGYEVLAPRRQEVDLTDASATANFVREAAPKYVIGAAATVGGIAANIADPVRFLTENIEIQNSLFLASAAAGVKHFIFMASSCIYPRLCKQPMVESSILTGPFEPTNESYAVAKVAGIQLAKALQDEGRLSTTVLIPCNIYGPGDSFDPERAHVASALVRKFVDAKHSGEQTVTIWGTGTVRRELMHSDDLARAVHFSLKHSDALPFLVNVGTGIDHTISEIAMSIAAIVEFQGEILYDPSKPDGMPRKVLDTTVLDRVGWRASIRLDRGLRDLVGNYEELVYSE